MLEQLVGQEWLVFQFEASGGLSFWVRDKLGSQAKVDYMYILEGQLSPIEVKPRNDRARDHFLIKTVRL